MKAQADPREICDEIAGELKEMASWLAAGRLSPEKFARAVLILEEAKVTRHGFNLLALRLPENRTQFHLRFAGSGRLCASIEYDPAKGELSTQHLCASDDEE